MRWVLVGVLGVAVCAGCGGGEGGTGRIRMIPNVVAGTQTMGAAAASQSLARSAVRIGSPRASNLRSLKYYITSIELCQDVQLMGSGFSNKSGCIELYTNQATGSPNYEGYMVDEARADTTAGRYVDLMTAEGQATLRRPVTLEVAVGEPEAMGGMGGAGMSAMDMRAGAYRFGLINFYRPIKVTAEMPVLGQPGEYFRTRAVTSVRSMPIEGGRWTGQSVLIGDTLSGPTEETTYMMNNGGVVFTFAKPFVITRADIDSGAEIKIDLVFNPDAFGQAYQHPDCESDLNRFICDPLNDTVIEMPYVRMNPVPRKSGERTRKETYLVDYDAGADLRVELYYNDADPEAGVQGADQASVYRPDATQPTMSPQNAYFVSQTGSVRTSDAAVTLQDSDRNPTLSGLRRRQAGSVTLHCQHVGPGCPMPGGTATRSYTFVGDTLVSTD